MASNTRRAIITDIHEQGLDPTKAHSIVARNGHLKNVPDVAEPKVALKKLEINDDVVTKIEKTVVAKAVVETVTVEANLKVEDLAVSEQLEQEVKIEQTQPKEQPKKADKKSAKKADSGESS